MGRAARTRDQATESRTQEEVTVTRSSGNVFADLGLPNPDERLRKSEFVLMIARVMQRRRLTQMKAAEVMGVAQPDLSKLLRGRTRGFSIDRLMEMLVALGVTTHISFEVPERFGRPGKVVVDEGSRRSA
jgi:predicted XRE-type DNA-binding protein